MLERDGPVEQVGHSHIARFPIEVRYDLAGKWRRESASLHHDVFVGDLPDVRIKQDIKINETTGCRIPARTIGIRIHLEWGHVLRGGGGQKIPGINPAIAIEIVTGKDILVGGSSGGRGGDRVDRMRRADCLPAGNAVEMLHKVLNGQPGESMPALRALDPQIAVDIVSYLPKLPKE